MIQIKEFKRRIRMRQRRMHWLSNLRGFANEKTSEKNVSESREFFFPVSTRGHAAAEARGCGIHSGHNRKAKKFRASPRRSSCS